MKTKSAITAAIRPYLSVILLIGLAALVGLPLRAGRAVRAAPDSTCTVTSAADAGAGSLRECLGQLQPGGRIEFDAAMFPPAAPLTITLAAPLPDIITSSVTIDASNAGVILDGRGLLGDQPGLHVKNADHVTIQGLQIGGFPDSGIELDEGVSYALIGGSRSVGSGRLGQGNRLSGNAKYGIVIQGSGTFSNTVAGNYVGVTITGTAALSNTQGILVTNGASYNVIGGRAAGEGNLVSGNDECGVLLGNNSANNHVIGNLIGTDASGTSGIPNVVSGVCAWNGAHHNWIGGTLAGERNIISGNEYGVALTGAAVAYNRVVGNYIGTDISGTQALPNRVHGVELYSGAHHNIVGGTTAEERNLISGNGYSGVILARPGTANNQVAGNYIGTDAAGLASLPNHDSGVAIFDQASQNIIGGGTIGERNLISGNIGNGVTIYGSATLSTTGNTVQGNYIGISKTGAQALPNTSDGVSVCSFTEANRIERNVISGNAEQGIYLDGPSHQTTIINNRIGVDPSGSVGVGNGQNGIFINQSSRANQVMNNTISGNGADGVAIAGNYNIITGNLIGTDLLGTEPIGNTHVGVALLSGAQFNTVGGDTSAQRNVIGGNGRAGVALYDPGTAHNTISGNYIGVSITGAAALSNGGQGVDIWGGPTDNTIGGDTRAAGNVISGNQEVGIDIHGSGTGGNRVRNNLIGVDAGGTAAIPNRWQGLAICDASNNDASGNVISGNNLQGVTVTGSSSDNRLSDNIIGADISGLKALPNALEGIAIRAEASLTTIGPGNTIAFNHGDGINISGANALYHTITRNSISDNTGQGINLSSGSNQAIARPEILTVTQASVSGTAIPNATIELFSDSSDEGRVFEGSTQSLASGTWSLVKASGFSGPYLTATATNATRSSSGFSLPVPTNGSEPLCSWTILIYLNGDNNLETWTFNLFNRLELAAANPCLHILALWDQRGEGDTVLYLVQPDISIYTLASYTEGANRWEQGELNMGDPQTLIDFVQQGRAAYPSTYTFLSIVDHGNGWSPGLPAAPRTYTHSGMSFDDSSDGAYLSTTALGLAFGAITNQGAAPLDVVFYDACLMSMIENMYPLRSYVHYLVASENESYTSYPYEEYLQGISAATQPADLARSIVDIYFGSLHGYPRTMAAYDLTKIQALTVAVNDLALALGDALPSYNNEIKASIDSSQRFDSNVDLALTVEDGYVDVYHFAALIRQNVPSPSVQAAAQAVLDAIGTPNGTLLLDERHASGFYWGNGEYWNLNNAHGVSIYLPLGEVDWLFDYYTDSELAFAADTAWNEFLALLIQVMQPPYMPVPLPVDPAKRPGPRVPGWWRVYLPVIELNAPAP